MCIECSGRPRVEVHIRERQSYIIPEHASRETRQYLTARQFPMEAATVRFSQQLVYTRVTPRSESYHEGGGTPMLSEGVLVDLFPVDRRFYEQIFTIPRDDALWEPLYESYQIWNHDMLTMVFDRHIAPERARGILHTLDNQLVMQLMAALISVAGTNIAPVRAPTGGAAAARHVATVVTQTFNQIMQLFGHRTSLADAVMAAARNARASGVSAGPPPPEAPRAGIGEIRSAAGRTGSRRHGRHSIHMRDHDRMRRKGMR